MAFGFRARHHFFWGEIAEVFKFQVCFGWIVEDGLGCDPVRNGIFIIRVIELVLVNRINIFIVSKMDVFFIMLFRLVLFDGKCVV